MKSSPIRIDERATILDVLRGFALFGVLLDNIFGFSGWGFLPQSAKEALPTWTADSIIGMLEQVFINGKFYSIFSLLFGIGFSIILIRNEQKEVDPLKIFYRRLFILLLIGVGHMLLLWEGDILFLYALIGFILPLFRKLSDRALFILAVLLIASPLLFDLSSVTFKYKNGDFLEKIALATDTSNGITEQNFFSHLYRDDSGWSEWRSWQNPVGCGVTNISSIATVSPKCWGCSFLVFMPGEE